MAYGRSLAGRGGVALLATSFLIAACGATATPQPTSPPTSASAPPATTSAAPPATSSTVPSTPSTSGSSSASGTLTVPQYDTYDDFNPNGVDGGTDTEVQTLNWDRLVAYDPSGNVEDRLAQSITSDPTGKVWTAHLRQNASWSDGKPFTSADVVYTFEILVNPTISENATFWDDIAGVAQYRSGAAASVSGITAPDANTVVFTLATPNGAFVNALTDFHNFIVQNGMLGNTQKMTKDQFDKSPVWLAPPAAIGPMKWVKTVAGQYLQFAPNPGWYGSPIKWSSLILKAVSLTLQPAQLESGDLDVAFVQQTDIPGLTSAGFQTTVANAPYPLASAFNVSKAPMSDVRVRQAIAYGCNTQQFDQKYFDGAAKYWTTYFWAPWVPTTGLNDYAYDPAKAKSLLQAAGFDFSKPIVWLSFNSTATDRQAYFANCQSQLAQIGVKVMLVSGSDATAPIMKSGNWDINTHGGSFALFDPDGMSTILECSGIPGGKATPGTYIGGGSNEGDWCDPAFDALMDQARQLSDQSKRAALYGQASLIFNTQLPILVNYPFVTGFAWSSHLKLPPLSGDATALLLDLAQWQPAP